MSDTTAAPIAIEFNNTKRQPAVAPIAPYAVRKRQAAAYLGVSLTTIEKKLREGVIESYIDGGCRLIVCESLRTHADQLRAKGARFGGAVGRVPPVPARKKR
jgi:excisionase family DNA binding protein